MNVLYLQQIMCVTVVRKKVGVEKIIYLSLNILNKPIASISLLTYELFLKMFYIIDKI